MQVSQIEEISGNVKKFLDRESEVNKKINQIEGRLSKMQNYFSRPEIADNNSSSLEVKSFNDYLRKGIEDGLITKKLSGEGGEAGVTLVPTLSKQVVNKINAKSPMRQLASIESISTRALDILIEGDAFTSGWVAEIGARDETDTAKLVKKTITAHELYAQPKATQSIMDDAAINMDSWLVERLVDSFIRKENEAFMTGDGANKPHGLLRNDDIVKIDVAAAVDPDMFLTLINSLEEGYLANASFLMNRKTLAAVQSLKDEQGRFIWQQSLSDQFKQTIFGVPVIVCSHMPDVARDSLSVAFGDFKSAYKIVDRSGISLVRDPYTEKPFVKFYAVKRVGGDVVNSAALKFAKFAAP